MDVKKRNVLFLTRCMSHGGTEKVMMQLFDILNDVTNKIVFCSSGGARLEELKEKGIKHYKIPDFSRKDFFTIIKTIRILKKIIKTENINLVHVHSRMGAFYMYYIKKIMHVEYCITAHSVFKNYKFLTRLSYKNVPIVCCGNSVFSNITEYYKIDKKNVVLINNTVTPNANGDEKTFIRNNKVFNIGFFGRLSNEKSLETLINAFSVEPLKSKNCHFYIVGDGEEKDKLTKLTEKLQLNTRISFLGYRHDTFDIMKKIDLVVLSSVIEGLPLVLIEAMSVGRAIVATNIPGVRDVVIDGDNGILVNVGDSFAFSEKIAYLIENPVLLKEYEVKALQMFEANYSYKTFKDSYVEFYKGL